MTLEELTQEHDAFTKAFYVDKTITQDEFNALHLANALAKAALMPAEESLCQ